MPAEPRAVCARTKKKSPEAVKNGLGAFAGATDPIRTDDLLITSELLYRLSHSSTLHSCNANYDTIKTDRCQEIPARCAGRRQEREKRFNMHE